MPNKQTTTSAHFPPSPPPSSHFFFYNNKILFVFATVREYASCLHTYRDTNKKQVSSSRKEEETNIHWSAIVYVRP